MSIDAFAFAPAEVSVQVGATVAWTNVQDGVKHTATSLDGVWDSGVLSTNDAFAFTLNQAGDFAYQCTIHPSMRGIIHVLASADTQAGPAAATDVPTPAPPAAATQPAAANQIPTATPAVAVQIPTATAVAATQIPAATPTPTVNVPATKPTATPAPYEY